MNKEIRFQCGNVFVKASTSQQWEDGDVSLCDVGCGEEGQIGKTKSWSGIPPVCLRLCLQLCSLWCRTLEESNNHRPHF